MKQLLCAFVVCLESSSMVLAQAEPSTAPAASAPETAAPAPPTYGGVVAEGEGYASASPADTPPRFGLSLATEATHAFGQHISAGGLGFSAAVFFAFNQPLGLAHLGVTTWPDGLRAGRSQEDDAHRRRNWEFFLGASLYPLDLGAVQMGLYILLSLANIDDLEAERAALGASLRWSISERLGLRYQLGLSAETNLVNTALVSSLALDLAIF
jgi:hypothetical protein